MGDGGTELPYDRNQEPENTRDTQTHTVCER